jgi:4-amino-4-deoxy-L-arabinose transferase-like glycosyltransferase
LWDIDEGLNAEAAREMLASGNLVVPTFNYKLRSAKPALLYWCQIGCYQLLGVNETAARLPSALATLLAIFGVYELGRRAFAARTALLAGLILTTSIAVLGASHFANPDALLLACTTWTIALYFRHWQTGGTWSLYGAAVACALAVLAKGPVGFLMPAAMVFLFLLWQRQLRRLIDLRLGEAFFVFFLVAAPWYIWVGTETKGQFLKEFLFTHHFDRTTTPMENHDGSPFYYVGVLLAGFLPWSIFYGPAAVNAWRQSKEESAQAILRFLAIWFAIWFVGFSVVKTKLPNYILPLYAALALLTADALERWRTGELVLPNWMLRTSLSCLALVGIGCSVGLLLASGAIPTSLPDAMRFTGLTSWAWVGAVPLVGAIVAWHYLRHDRRDAMLATLTVTATVFLTVITGGVVAGLNDHKPTRILAKELPADHEYREIRVAAFHYDRPTLVFYCRREVPKIHEVSEAQHLMGSVYPAYLFVPESRWRKMEGQMPKGVKVLGRCPDLYARGEEVLVVTNEEIVKAGLAQTIAR